MVLCVPYYSIPQIRSSCQVAKYIKLPSSNTFVFHTVHEYLKQLSSAQQSVKKYSGQESMYRTVLLPCRTENQQYSGFERTNRYNLPSRRKNTFPLEILHLNLTSFFSVYSCMRTKVGTHISVGRYVRVCRGKSNRSSIYFLTQFTSHEFFKKGRGWCDPRIGYNAI